MNDDAKEKAPASARNLVELFEWQAGRMGSRPVVRQKLGGQWKEFSWSEVARRSRDVSDGLASLGVQRGDRISVIGETALDYLVADVGIMGSGAIAVPIY